MSSYTCHVECNCVQLPSDFLILSDVTLDGDDENGSEEEDGAEMTEPPCPPTLTLAR